MTGHRAREVARICRGHHTARTSSGAWQLGRYIQIKQPAIPDNKPLKCQAAQRTALIAATTRLFLPAALGSFLPPFAHSKAAAWDNLPVEKAIVPGHVLCYLLDGTEPHVSPVGPFPLSPLGPVALPARNRAPAAPGGPSAGGGWGLLAGPEDALQQSSGGHGAGRGLGAGGRKPDGSRETPAAHCWVSSVRGMLHAEKPLLLPMSRVPFLWQELSFDSV